MLILRSYWTPQFPNVTIPPIWLSSHSITQKILLSLHYFLTLQFQTFTSLPIGIFGVSNPTDFLLLLRFLRNYVSIIVNIISNNTVLQCYLLWIRRLLQLIACIAVSTPPHLKNMTPSFGRFLLESANYPSPSFLSDSPPLRAPKKIVFHAPPPPHEKKLICQWTPIILKFFIINPIPSFKSN